ncbi:5-methylthioribose kinase [Helcococcus kunzii ATCC 51366]|uniref:S-methyl-5-thioribose kinase n=1 Tax=Helcococcus kunzii ATCC 51366 TaxID=883114 RepID=H3NQ90_9FIRM|nr:S-methyl-5-thioribose kinase [Helcococcus kunzii]EHR32570.1 5-methylthioribose kinase [Helcococcus kunzii ATCC 51366]
MKNIYDSHFLLNENTVIDFVKDKLDIFKNSINLKSKELSDGNINYVFKVWDEDTDNSVVVKQADDKLRSSGRNLDLNRNKIEYEILKKQNELVPKYVPKVYYYDNNMYCMIMEDISEYKNMRYEINKGKIFNNFSKDITTYLVETLLETTDLIIDRHEKKEKVKLFTNIDLCDISEDLVFTEPYYNYKNRNIIVEGLEQFVEENLYNNQKLHTEVGYLRNRFMNYSQSLIHGDLHSGSIFINQNGIKVIDPEFAFYGPAGYDIGNVIGNLFFSLANKEITDPENTEYIEWVKNQISEIYDLFSKKFKNKFKERVKLPIYNNEFMNQYLDEILSDSLGYAGTEIIRRTVGDSKVLEVTDIETVDKYKLHKQLIELGITLIINRKNIRCGDEIIKQYSTVKINR